MTELDICYEFVDAMFTRKLFLLVSWGGGSKSSITKTSFRNFHNTIEFVTSLVRKIHPDFSETTCQYFFKKDVISNSTKRAEKPPQRVSRTRIRKKKNVAMLNVDGGNSEDDGDFGDTLNLFETPNAIASTEVEDPLLVPLAVPGPSKKGAESKSSVETPIPTAKRKAEQLKPVVTAKKSKQTQQKGFRAVKPGFLSEENDLSECDSEIEDC